MVEGGIFLAKQYRATEGGLAARRFFLGRLRERFIYVLAKKCPLDKLRERRWGIFSYLPSSIEPWRAALRMQNRVAILQSSGKSMEGFSGGNLRGIGGAAEAVP
ncbi:MAG TPA: hypothetical protein DCZ76_01325 [Treponema sp.]|nr:hypothetical protein [Treponema sp.]